MTAYYNEHDAFCAGWLRNLVTAGFIAAGDVDERDICDVCPDDLRGYTQAHFFAGLGGWPGALRLAGWPDDRPIWTGSCPCQPFSQAGKGGGFADDRHLWPAWSWLIRQRRPRALAGEQIASPDGLAWLDVVSADLEALGYACGAVDFPSAGVGAPNIRQRLFWVAQPRRATDERRRGPDDASCSAGAAEGQTWERQWGGNAAGNCLPDDRLADAARIGSSTGARKPNDGHGAGEPDGPRDAGGLAHPNGRDARAERIQRCGEHGLGAEDGGAGVGPHRAFGARGRGEGRAVKQSSGPLDPWRELEWIDCRDGKARPTQPGIFPLAARHPGDVAKLRAYGNAINFVAAAEVIRAWLEAELVESAAEEAL